jgi:hypothetical protein
MKGDLPWVVRWACCAGTRYFCSALAALIGHLQNIFVPIVHYFNSFFPIAQEAGQAAVRSRLSLNMCLKVQKATVLLQFTIWYSYMQEVKNML